MIERLRELEADGLVERIVDPGPPITTTYRLTPSGTTLQPALEVLRQWASEATTTTTIGSQSATAERRRPG
jgi:DNA-binding HxlR family transcriptional regulator